MSRGRPGQTINFNYDFTSLLSGVKDHKIGQIGDCKQYPLTTCVRAGRQLPESNAVIQLDFQISFE